MPLWAPFLNCISDIIVCVTCHTIKCWCSRLHHVMSCDVLDWGSSWASYPNLTGLNPKLGFGLLTRTGLMVLFNVRKIPNPLNAFWMCSNLNCWNKIYLEFSHSVIWKLCGWQVNDMLRYCRNVRPTWVRFTKQRHWVLWLRVLSTKSEEDLDSFWWQVVNLRRN